MTRKEMREKVSDYCNNVKCDECVLRDHYWFNKFQTHDNYKCLDIERATDMELNRALSMIRGTKDNVNHPSHYQGKNECIDVMVAMFGVEAVKSFCKCNAYKYRFRSNAKNGDEDIKKAEWYETKLIELEKEV